ncbi:hypothetical protein SAMN05518861_10435 [Mesorhizobium sp. YR577]|nr:hypothetical protein SAMN05518861_10435 [Mesorhizobium sp. YR577]
MKPWLVFFGASYHEERARPWALAMSPTLSNSSVALQILQQSTPQTQSAADKPSTAHDVLAITGGVSNTQTSAGRSAIALAQARISESYFSVHYVDTEKMKVRLYERAGQALGIEMADFDSSAAYGTAIKRAFLELKVQPGSDEAITEIEKNLGLDKLGISLWGLIKAILDPAGEDSAKLDKALKKLTGEDAKGDQDDSDQKAALNLFRSDEIGIYSF